MANREKLRIKSALKRSRQNIKRNELRSPQRAAARTAVKAVSSAIESGDKSNAEKKFKEAGKILVTMVSKKVIHRNKASRTKSRLNTKVKSL